MKLIHVAVFVRRLGKVLHGSSISFQFLEAEFCDCKDERNLVATDTVR